MKDISIEEWNSTLLTPLCGAIATKRWFPGDRLEREMAELTDAVRLGDESCYYMLILSVSRGGTKEHFIVPVRATLEEDGQNAGLLTSLTFNGGVLFIYDAVEDAGFHILAVKAISDGMTFKSGRGEISTSRTPFFSGNYRMDETYDTRVVRSEQSNSSVIYSDRLIYKNFRKLSGLPNPDYDVPLHLCSSESGITPEPLGCMTYHGKAAEGLTGILFEYVRNSGEAWDHFVSGFSGNSDLVVGDGERIGSLTAAMHNALAGNGNGEFAPRAITGKDVDSWKKEYGDLVREVSGMVSESSQDLAGIDGQRLADEEDAIFQASDALGILSDEGVHKIRIHGDYHLGQILKTESGYMVIDFEGEPARSPEYRRSRNCAVKDVGGILRSIDYASRIGGSIGEDSSSLRKRCGNALVERYWEEHETGSGYLPEKRESFLELLRFYTLEKAIYEMKYELLYRPSWAWMPATAVLELAGGIGH